MTRILGIETSCDETAAAVVDDRCHVRSNVVASQIDLHARFGSMGERLYSLARGRDHRRVSANAPVKSISNETTFYEDTSDPDLLDGHIWRLAENVSDRAKARGLAGRVVPRDRHA